MKIKTIFTLDQKKSPPKLFRVVSTLARSGVSNEHVRIEAMSGESLKLLQIAALVALCRASGLQRSNLGDIGTYGLVKIRQYEPEDLNACEILSVSDLRKRDIEIFEKRDTEGRLILHAGSLARLWDFGQVNHRIIVSHECRQALEKEKFTGLSFREVAIQGPGVPQAVMPCWELAAKITLPKLANTGRLMCYGIGGAGKVEPFNGDYSRMLFIEDPPYAGGEAHYRRRDLENLGPFDVAETFEHVWIPQRSLVISQRFYKYCTSLGMPMLVVPVRIDAG